MRLRAIFFLLVATSLLLVSGGRDPSRAVGAGCPVSANYIEAVDENLGTLLKVLAMTSTRSLLDDAETGGIYYTMLLSTRHYHEEMREQLPDCAQELNILMVETIAATQDVVALKIAQSANPEHLRYVDRLRAARAHLDAKWQMLVGVSRETQLVPVAK